MKSYEASFANQFSPDVYDFSFWKGRIALYAILKALGIGPGDEVILPGYTCVVVANSIRFTGATPVYVDIVPDSYNIDPLRVEAALTSRTKAVLLQHTYGIPGPVNELLDLSHRYHFDLIEDCAHALGSTFAGRPLGTFGRAAFFSSQWSKPYTTGLGGIALTCDPVLAGRMETVLSSFVQPPFAARLRLNLQYFAYQHFFYPRIYWQAQSILQGLGSLGLFVGSSSDSELEGEMPVDHTWCMAPAQQKAGLAKLAAFRNSLSHRSSITAIYDRAFSDHGWPPTSRPSGTSLLRYPVRVANKEELLTKARQAHVELGSWFETPLHPTPLARHSQFDFQLGKYPYAEKAASQVVNLPLHTWITEKEAGRILDFFFCNAVQVEA